jgi:6-phosphofructokinase 1
MENLDSKKGIIGILTDGGDIPGLNPAIRGVTLRAIREGYQVTGIRHGWADLVDMVREKDYDNSDNFVILDEEVVDRAGRTGGTFLHSSRTSNVDRARSVESCATGLRDFSREAQRHND